MPDPLIEAWSGCIRALQRLTSDMSDTQAVLGRTAVALTRWHELVAKALPSRRGPAPNSTWKKLILDLKVNTVMSAQLPLFPAALNSLAQVPSCEHQPQVAGELVCTVRSQPVAAATAVAADAPAVFTSCFPAGAPSPVLRLCQHRPAHAQLTSSTPCGADVVQVPA